MRTGGVEIRTREFLEITFKTIEIPNIQYPSITNNFYPRNLFIRRYAIKFASRMFSEEAEIVLDLRTLAICIKGYKKCGKEKSASPQVRQEKPQSIEHKP